MAAPSPANGVATAPIDDAPASTAPTPRAGPMEAVLTVREPVRVQSGGGLNPLWTAALSGLAALLGAAVGYVGTTRNGRATIIQKTNELEIESIEKRLSEFVGPFLHLSGENKILALELKRNQPDAANFRTLTALLTKGWLAGLAPGDKTLLDAVVENGKELRKLMSEKGSSAVSIQLMPYFSKASAHFRMLELAAAGSLEMDPARYSEYVYPRQLDGVMLAEQKRLLDRREALRSKPSKAHPSMPDLVIPGDLKLPDKPASVTTSP
ncbi:hypothetical protein [Sphingomonas sp. NIBR02145]|uniref:hypothetical protein n=1 Tax=Sphingomonas sp. NIBR02145 TaxID=3014784 RepID=UPI0022B540E8|nr:hypothetical protein [Sphingomonas sp. NIBR02145]WHU04273.1 hypothetical protein O3305_06715 [Sphingomonas sp. NIBR02145]